MSAHPLRNKAAIVGVAESEIGKVPHMTGLGLNAQAARRALDDAGLEMAEVDGLLTAYSVSEPYPMLGTVLAEYLGLRPRYAASVVTGGATPAVMLSHAAQAVASGQASVVLVTAGENRATGITRDQAVKALSAFGGHPYFEDPYGPHIPGCYAMIARRYMHDYGVAREDLARVSVQTRAHACRHPNAHMSKPISIDDVLESKPIAEPLNLLDCCLISDAAGAFVVTSAERAKDLRSKPVYLLGAGEAHTHEHILAAPSLTEFGTRQSAERAYAMAGLRPRDIDFAELYDCFSVVPILEAEEVGLAPRGEGAALWREGRAALEGDLPINTHGGMLSHAHAGAAGGLFGIVEATRQLRGHEGERQVKRHEVALVHNEGGILSSHGTVILGAQPV